MRSCPGSPSPASTPWLRLPCSSRPAMNRWRTIFSFLTHPCFDSPLPMTSASHPLCPQSTDELDEQLTQPTAGALEAVESCPGDILVLGAAGKMGFHTARLLQRCLQQLQRPDRVIAISRFSSDSSRRPFEKYQIETIQADLCDPQQLEALPSAPNLFFLAGVKFGTSDDADLLYRMNGEMPRLVAQRFCDARIVALSTGCVYAFTSPESGGSTEQSPLDPPGDYAKSCVARERAFMDGSSRHGTRCSLVRLNYSVELRYGVLVDIAMQVMSGEPINVETPYVNVIWQGDAITQIVQCLPCTASPPFVVNITGGDTLSVREVAQRFGSRFGVTPTFRGQEASTCWLSNSSLARSRFGEPSMTVDRMIDWIVDWLLRGGPTLGKPTKFQVRDGKY